MVRVATPDEASLLFEANFPDNELNEICHAIVRGHKKAFVHCNTFSKASRRYLLPHERLAVVQDEIGKISSANIAFRFPSNKSRNFDYILVKTNGAMLTISSTPCKDMLPRSAEFRKEHSRDSQFSLLEENIATDLGTPVYAILIHGEAKTTPWLPAFIQIVFPNREYTRIEGQSIDLIAKFPDVAERLVLREETIDKAFGLRFRKPQADELLDQE